MLGPKTDPEEEVSETDHRAHLDEFVEHCAEAAKEFGLAEDPDLLVTVIHLAAAAPNADDFDFVTKMSDLKELVPTATSQVLRTIRRRKEFE